MQEIVCLTLKNVPPHLVHVHPLDLSTTFQNKVPPLVPRTHWVTLPLLLTVSSVKETNIPIMHRDYIHPIVQLSVIKHG